MSQSLRHMLLLPLATGLAYYLGAVLGVAASAMSEGIAIFWLPNGILLVVLLSTARHHWPLHLAAAVLAEIAADLPTFTLLQALGFAAVNVVECLLAALLLERLARPFRLESLRHVIAFGGYVLVIACGLAALLGAAIYSLTGQATTAFWTYWRIWWFGDGLGMLLVAPLALGWLQPRSRPGERRSFEATALFGLTLLFSLWVFYPSAAHVEAAFPRRAFLLLPFALWAAARFGVWGTASVALLLAGIAIPATLTDRGPLALAAPEATVLLLQEYLVVLSLPALALAALLQELRDRNARLQSRETELRMTHDALDRVNRELETRVRTRTEALEVANRRLKALASVDSLTGISNRRHFVEQAKAEISRARRQGLPLSVIMFDIDFFKTVNDRFGHEAGDQTLKALTSTVSGNLRAGDIFARLGGEEFILMLPGQGLGDAVQTADRVRALVAETSRTHYPVPITLSAGVAGLAGSEDLDGLLRQADRALYAAKHQGRDRVCVAPAAGAPETLPSAGPFMG
ncbi:GGDEF domain-containing protein [Thiobacillus denitrificans]|uniref:GGDEF domain-containing protein n=1 Tax=Thiobacillus denitrificans TaxID=36861 RepID=UPI001EE3A810|nr:diguanylate cyclase [Thiobacillus denitrificans]